MTEPDVLAQDLAERFFAISIDMLCVAGFDGYFRWLNPAWEETLGFTAEELRSRPMIEFIHPEDRELTRAQNREVRKGGKALSFENRYLCRDGSHKWLLWNAAPDFDHEVIYAAARDVTERKRAVAEREAMVQDLQTALDEIKTLRAILPICSYCKRIRDDEDNWQTIDTYISRHTNTRFSHGICPACYETEVGPL